MLRSHGKGQPPPPLLLAPPQRSKVEPEFGEEKQRWSIFPMPDWTSQGQMLFCVYRIELVRRIITETWDGGGSSVSPISTSISVASFLGISWCAAKWGTVCFTPVIGTWKPQNAALRWLHAPKCFFSTITWQLVWPPSLCPTWPALLFYSTYRRPHALCTVSRSLPLNWVESCSHRIHHNLTPSPDSFQRASFSHC